MRRKRPHSEEEREPQRIGALALAAFADLAGPERAALMDVLAAWPAAVGEQVSAAARPSRLKDGILTVEVVSPVWSQQLSLMAPRVLAQLNSRLGGEMVRELRFCAARKARG
jgi:predicted nucleic acid-binding Zn ribbon protein